MASGALCKVRPHILAVFFSRLPSKVLKVPNPERRSGENVIGSVSILTLRPLAPKG